MSRKPKKQPLTEKEEAVKSFEGIYLLEEDMESAIKAIAEKYYLLGYKKAKDKYVPKICPDCGLSRTFEGRLCVTCTKNFKL